MTVSEVIKWCSENSKNPQNSLIIQLLDYANKDGVVNITEKEANEFYNSKVNQIKMCDYLKSRTALRIKYNEKTGVPYAERYIENYCSGTKGRERCSCGGDKSKCSQGAN